MRSSTSRSPKGVDVLFILAFVAITSCTSTGSSQFGPQEISTAWSGDSLVRVDSGLVRGYPDEIGTLAWKGIPYAAPPVGELRWRSSIAPAAWDDVYDAKRFCDPCVQYSPIIRNKVVGSEDCLYLNIWRPDSIDEGLPVYVWIHGGGNSIGSASFVPDYYGHSLASKGNLVFVSLNYRLGPLGWMTHPSIRGQANPEDASGNYGTLDIINALEWIQANIRAFGGNPDQVTIAGESSGGVNVLSLLFSPLTDGLFHRAVIQSGAPNFSTLEDGDLASKRLFNGEPESDDPARMLDIARSVPARVVMATTSAVLMGITGMPAVFADGFVLPADGFDKSFRNGEVHNVPIIIGSNKHEVKLFLWFAGDLRWDSEQYQAVGRFSSDLWKADGVDSIARALAAQPNREPVYSYWFGWGSPNDNGDSPLSGNWPAKLGAFHTLEIPFFLGNDTINGRLLGSLWFSRRNRLSRHNLSDAMTRYLAAFVRNGDPNANLDGLPHWKPWSNEEGAAKTIVFDVDGDEADISMMTQEYTRDSIYETMRRELSPELYADVEGRVRRR